MPVSPGVKMELPMKKLSSLKVVHFAFTFVITMLCIYELFQPSLRAEIFRSAPSTTLFVCVWLLLLVDYVFLLLDFRALSVTKSDYNELYSAVYADQASGLPNRFSCDVMIDKYSGSSLPAELSCVIVNLTSLFEINDRLGHAEGNRALREFSSIISSAAVSLCFVGRNGGNKFLAIFEQGGRVEIDSFLALLRAKVDSYNAHNPDAALVYSVGCALNREENCSVINKLISTANRRAESK